MSFLNSTSNHWQYYMKEGSQTNLATDLFPLAMMPFSSAASIVGAIHEGASEYLPHPVQDKLTH